MQYLNNETSILHSPEFIGSAPDERGTWFAVSLWCAQQENGGRIVGARLWKDRQWQQTCGVTAREIARTTRLIAWDGDDALVWNYPIDKEIEVQAKRNAGRETARRRWPQPTSSANSSATSSADTEGKGREGKGMEEEGNGINTLSSTRVDLSPASPDDGSAISLELVADTETAPALVAEKRKRKPDDTPYVQILEAWGRHCPHLTQPQMPTPARQATMRAFWQTVKTRTEKPHEWLDWLFQTVSGSDFLSGRKTDFRADLFWVIKPANLAKIVDGNYSNRKNP